MKLESVGIDELRSMIPANLAHGYWTTLCYASPLPPHSQVLGGIIPEMRSAL